MTTENPQTSPETGTENQPEQKEMCCDGQQTAEEHRHNSPDGKCCIDN